LCVCVVQEMSDIMSTYMCCVVCLCRARDE